MHTYIQYTASQTWWALVQHQFNTVMSSTVMRHESLTHLLTLLVSPGNDLSQALTPFYQSHFSSDGPSGHTSQPTAYMQ